jgi:PHD/YefM family antitoxin component YafN of YafNO toxin-antitoxin module
MTTTLPITQVRINLGDIVKRVHLNQERFILEKDGYPVAALVGLDELDDILDVRDKKEQKRVTRSAREYHKGEVKSARKLLSDLKK